MLGWFRDHSAGGRGGLGLDARAAPVTLAVPDIPIPVSPVMEDEVVPSVERIAAAARTVLASPSRSLAYDADRAAPAKDWDDDGREATIAHWYVAVGDAVSEGDDMCEVDTDKANAVLPARSRDRARRRGAGRLEGIAGPGDVLAVIESDGDLRGGHARRRRGGDRSRRGRLLDRVPAVARSPAGGGARATARNAADETSKSNTGVADCGMECEPGSLESRLIVASSARWRSCAICSTLPSGVSPAGSASRGRPTSGRLDQIAAGARANGARARVLGGEEARALAPCITDDTLGALEIPDEGVIDSIRLTLGYAELAALNGVTFHFSGAPVVGARIQSERVTEVHTPTLTGPPAVGGQRRRAGRRPRVADAGGRGIPGLAATRRVSARRSRVRRATSRRVITRLPTEHTRGVMVVPATHGSVLLGPTADDAEDKADRSTHDDVLARVLRECCELVPSLKDAPVIKKLCGLRPASDRTYRIELSGRARNLVQACGSARPASRLRRRSATTFAMSSSKRACGPTSCAGALLRIPKRRRLAEDLDCEAMASDPLGRTGWYAPARR